MKYLFNVSSFICMLLITLNTTCMLTRYTAVHNPRIQLSLLQQFRKYNPGYSHYTEDPTYILHRLQVLEKRVQSLQKKVESLEKNVTLTESENALGKNHSPIHKLGYENLQSTHNDHSYIPEHNMHYRNPTHE